MLASSFPLGFFIALCWAAFAFSVLLTVVFRKKVGPTIVLGLVLTAFLTAGACFFASPSGRSAGVWARSRLAVAERAHRPPRHQAAADAAIRAQRIEAEVARMNAETRLAEAEAESLLVQLHDDADTHDPQPAARADGHIPPPPVVAPMTPVPSAPAPHGPRPPDGFEVRRLLDDLDTLTDSRVASSLLSALAIAAFLGLGYIACDSMTRGHFTWHLRIIAAFTFVVLWLAATALRTSF